MHLRRRKNEIDQGAEAPVGALLTFIEGCLRDWESLPPPDGPITVGIDGVLVTKWRGFIQDELDKEMVSAKAGGVQIRV